MIKSLLRSVIIYAFASTLFAADHNLYFDSPITRWDEALPLGNGIMGCLVWGNGQPFKLSLDRADLWDLRPVPEWSSPDYNYATMRRWVAQGRIQDLHRLYDDPYDLNAAPTKIPAGRLELTFPNTVHVQSSELDITAAMAKVHLTDGTLIEVIQDANHPVGLVRITGPSHPQIKLVAPAFGGPIDTLKQTTSLQTGSLARLGYPSSQEFHTATSLSFLQQGWGGFSFAIATEWHQQGKEKEIVWSITTKGQAKDPLHQARSFVNKTLKKGFERTVKEHKKWWSDYWQQSGITVPNKVIEKQWYLDTYKFGAASRPGSPPISLQAVWTADTGTIPPWKGDFHHDLNTQLSYWPCYSANHLREGLAYLDWLWQVKPEAKKFAQKFFDKPGLNVPMTTDLEGKQIGGWHQYTHSATTAAWLSHHFYLHWRYSMDRDFLQHRAYPFLKETAIFLEAITEKDSQGKRFLPLSSSPEINDNRLEAWLPPTSNYDLALMRWLFAGAAELAEELGLAQDKAHWLQALSELPDLSVSPEDGRLLVAPGMPLKESHRHFSHLMAIHPLGLIRWDNGPTEQNIIRQALQEMDRLGPNYWCGYSYAWQASMAARAKDGERAERALEIFSKAFCSPNSFHLNGDQTKSGYSQFTYRPFTLEGNFAAAAGLQEMLLASYAGLIEIMPAVPASWQEVSFKGLRAEGAFILSAQRHDGRITQVEIVAEQGGVLKLKNPFQGRVKFNLKKAKLIEKAERIVISCDKASTVRLTAADD